MSQLVIKKVKFIMGVTEGGKQKRSVFEEA